jgi:hypothetical protein
VGYPGEGGDVRVAIDGRAQTAVLTVAAQHRVVEEHAEW